MPCNDPPARQFVHIPPGLCYSARIDSDNGQVATSVMIVNTTGLVTTWSQSDLEPGPAQLPLAPSEFYIFTVRIKFLAEDTARFRCWVGLCGEGQNDDSQRNYCREIQGGPGNPQGIAIALRTLA